MFVWIGLVCGILIASSYTSGLVSAVLDLAAFVIILGLGVRRVRQGKVDKKGSVRQLKTEADSSGFIEEVKQINSVTDRLDITP
ncbi:hypothetical protein PTW35_22030 (plasmid) [Photobacterium sp. DA100]|uniref:hypothetical protein n=1 Tax=Photobacterium sp. DA100 TaxID=3027472 RepID=UPI002478663F|nr:hypothetical protein [Photobacterium sp. DA100]WEM45754.1 hypothetical protein PTW35_22030 [Photobacterium sp. DA100]